MWIEGENVTGIYCIENTVNGKKYIGKAVNIELRWTTHRRSLNANKHYNKHLQGAWNVYGSESFLFYVVELCDKQSLDARERHYIQAFESLINGYNMTLGGDGSLGRKHTDEAKKKMSDHFMGRPLKQSTKDKIRDSKIGKYCGEDNPTYGRHRTMEEKQAVSVAQGVPVVQLTLDGILVGYFPSALDAFRKTGINNANICRACIDNTKTAGGFMWVYGRKGGENSACHF